MLLHNALCMVFHILYSLRDPSFLGYLYAKSGDWDTFISLQSMWKNTEIGRGTAVRQLGT